LAQRKKKKKRRHGPAPSPRPSGAAMAEERRAKTEAKNAAVRATLQPLEPGERPKPVTIGAIVATVLAAIQIPLYLLWTGDERPAVPGFLIFMGLMVAMAWGMWHAKYWAVLGFQALLGLAVLILALLLTIASNWIAAVVCVVIIVPAATLFWFMVKAMARIQMPDRPESLR
jgi:hypothetical protein